MNYQFSGRNHSYAGREGVLRLRDSPARLRDIDPYFVVSSPRTNRAVSVQRRMFLGEPAVPPCNMEHRFTLPDRRRDRGTLEVRSNGHISLRYRLIDFSLHFCLHARTVSFLEIMSHY